MDNAKGFKAFNPGLVCEPDSKHRKQYEENTTYEEKGGGICSEGMMHYCVNPLDVLNYYPLLNNDCELSDFTTVEALEPPVTDDNKKFATKKLRIGAKLDLKGFIKASVDFLMERGEKDTVASGYWSQLAASGDGSKLAASGDWSKLAASGYWSQLAASGYGSQLAASGYGSQLAASGYGSKLAASGDGSQLAASGNGSQLAASGDGSKLAASGDGSQLALNGKNSVGAAIGYNNQIKGVVGSWITLAEYDNGVCICVKSAQIDGKTIKADTWYTLKNGELVGVL